MQHFFDSMRGVLGLATYVFIAAAILEALWDFRVKKRKDKDLKETLANLGVSAFRQILRLTLTGGVLLAILTAVAPYRLATLPLTPWTIALTLLVADFTYYWTHRASHEIRYFWTYHAVHHSSKEFNFSTAIRLPWLDFADALFYLPAVLVGFDPKLLVAAKGLVLVYQFWIHTEAIGRLGRLEGLVNTPSAHRVHHASNGRYLDKNHGGVLMIWDRLFGTYEEEREPVVYGLTKPLGRYSPFAINFKEPLSLLRDMGNARSFGEAVRFSVSGPGWKPASQSARFVTANLERQ